MESASLHRQSILWSPSAITVFTREDIRVSGATDLPDLLRRVPGFDVYEAKPSFPLVGARALTDESNNLVLLLVDGREDLAEITGFAFWNNLTFDLEEIERVEVIRGPDSALYGANAFAAVVSVTTVADRPDSGGQVLVRGGQEGHQRLLARVRQTVGLAGGTLDSSIAIGREAFHSPSDPADALADEYRMHGYLRYRNGPDLDLSLQAGGFFGDGVIYINMGDFRFLDGRNYWVMGKGGFGLGPNLRLHTQLSYTRYVGLFRYRTRLQAYNIWLFDIPDIDLGIHTVDTQLQLDWQIADRFLLIAGASLRYNTLTWDRTILVTDKDELRAALFLNAQWCPWDVLQLTAGLRLDVNTSTEAAVSPRVVAVFRPWQEHFFRLGYSLAFRRPSYFENRIHVQVDTYNPAFPEMVARATTQIGNENLGNEKVYSLEAGWQTNLLDGQLRLSLDGYYSLYRNTITFTVAVPTRLGLPDMSQATFQYENQGTEVNALGGEAEVVWSPTGNWELWANLSRRHVTNRATGERMASEPRWRANLGGRYLHGAGLFADLAVHYVSAYSMRQVDPADTLGNPIHVLLGDQTLLIARLGYQLAASAEGAPRTLKASLTLQAPLGKPFREYPGAAMPLEIQVDTRSDFGGELLHRVVVLELSTEF